MSDAPPDETPWDVAKRMRAEGQPRSAIEARLSAMGLSSEDANVLLIEDPPKGSGGPGLSGAATAVALVAGGPLLAGLAVAALSDRVEEREAPGPQAPLAATDTTTNRCAQHPELASVATCSRCGAFACRSCAPQDGSLCGSCEANPAVHEERVRTAARRTGYATFSFVGLLLMEGLLAIDAELIGRLFLLLAAVAAPFLVLGVAQLMVSSRAPAIMALVYAGGVLVAAMRLGAIGLVGGLWVLSIGLLFALVMALGTARRQWKGRLAAQPLAASP